MKISTKVLHGSLADMLATTGGAAMAQENAMLAQQELEAVLADWNRADCYAPREHLSFPHISHRAGNLVIA